MEQSLLKTSPPAPTTDWCDLNLGLQWARLLAELGIVVFSWSLFVPAWYQQIRDWWYRRDDDDAAPTRSQIEQDWLSVKSAAGLLGCINHAGKGLLVYLKVLGVCGGGDLDGWERKWLWFGPVAFLVFAGYSIVLWRTWIKVRGERRRLARSQVTTESGASLCDVDEKRDFIVDVKEKISR